MPKLFPLFFFFTIFSKTSSVCDNRCEREDRFLRAYRLYVIYFTKDITLLSNVVTNKSDISVKVSFNYNDIASKVTTATLESISFEINNKPIPVLQEVQNKTTSKTYMLSTNNLTLGTHNLCVNVTDKSGLTVKKCLSFYIKKGNIFYSITGGKEITSQNQMRIKTNHCMAMEVRLEKRFSSLSLDIENVYNETYNVTKNYSCLNVGDIYFNFPKAGKYKLFIEAKSNNYKEQVKIYKYFFVEDAITNICLNSRYAIAGTNTTFRVSIDIPLKNIKFEWFINKILVGETGEIFHMHQIPKSFTEDKNLWQLWKPFSCKFC